MMAALKLSKMGFDSHVAFSKDFFLELCRRESLTPTRYEMTQVNDATATLTSGSSLEH